MAPRRRIRFSWDLAVKTVDSFARTSGIHCRLYGEGGILLYEQGSLTDGCAFCHQLTAITGKKTNCGEIHRHGAMESQRFGGRYIYLCPSGLAYFSSPILTDGGMSGALVCGPVLIMDPEDLLDEEDLACMTPDQLQGLLEDISVLPRMEPARLSDWSAQLFANGVLISDETHTFFATQRSNRQQDAIGAYIHQIKSAPQAPPYPLESEHDLLREISQGSLVSAQSKLDTLLGYLYSFAPGEEEATWRAVELAVMMERGAMLGGAPEDQARDVGHRTVRELELRSGGEERARILDNALRMYMALLSPGGDTDHANAIQRGINYMKGNCYRKLTLQETAEYVGYAHTYFSKLFRREQGCSFQEYLNRLRVERGKTLLLEGSASLSEICGMVGLADQSYFCKVFKRITGVTPSQYRLRMRRIDEDREREGEPGKAEQPGRPAESAQRGAQPKSGE